MQRITVQEAAEVLQVPLQAVRVRIQRGLYPWGKAYKNKGRYTYVIYKEHLDKWLTE